MRKFLVGLMLGPIVGGCTPTLEAYWSKPTKYKEMPDYKHRDAVVPVATLSLDATRRLVISQYDAEAKKRITCPEPPPDAVLSTLSQTLASLKSKGVEASVSGSYEALAQALHARTSSVEFWRTTSSMYCVLLMNGFKPEAQNYLVVAMKTIGVTKDTVVTSAAAANFTEALIAAAVKKTADDATRGAAEQARARAERLKAAKEKCANVADDKKKDDLDCQIVEAEDQRKASEKTLAAAGLASSAGP